MSISVISPRALHGLFVVVLLLFSHPIQGHSCWSHLENEPVVGMDLGWTHGTSVVAFPNGTFVNVALVETDKIYQDWIYRTLQNALKSSKQGILNKRPKDWSESHQVGIFSKLLSWVPSFAQIRLDSQTIYPPVDPIQEALQVLFIDLKNQTESFLRTNLTDVALTIPQFFNDTQTAIVFSAFEDASLQTVACFNAKDSLFAAALFERHILYQSLSKQEDSVAQCAFGPPGVDNVVVADYTGSFLVVDFFEMHIGRHVWSRGDTPSETFVALNTSGEKSIAGQQQADSDFWTSVGKGMRALLPRHTWVGDWTVRLMLKGANPRGSELKETISSALGEMIPSQQSPHAVKFSFTEKELAVHTWEEIEYSKGFSCLYRDGRVEVSVKHYEKSLLGIVNAPVSVDMRYAAASGAALLVMDMKESKLGCAEWNDAATRFHYRILDDVPSAYRGDMYE